jgi:hypothetical protein
LSGATYASFADAEYFSWCDIEEIAYIARTGYRPDHFCLWVG